MSELKNIPKEIYINIGDDEHCEIDFNFDDLTDVTWCTHAIDDNDIKYYLADDVDKHIKELEEALENMVELVNILDAFKNHKIKTIVNTAINNMELTEQSKADLKQAEQLLKGGE